MTTASILSKQYHDFAQQIPADTTKKALGSFVFSFAITTGLSGNPALGLACGVIAAVASLTHAITTPIFRKLAESNDNPNTATWYQQLARLVVDITSASLAAAALGYRLDIVAVTFFNSIWTLATNGFDNHSLNHSCYFLIV